MSSWFGDGFDSLKPKILLFRQAEPAWLWDSFEIFLGKDYIRGQERFIGPKNDNDTDTVERVEGWEAKVLLQL